ncbi:MAG: hypothetical protein ACRDGV_05775 [Candidatus Limnocylindria bacterium]
MPGGRPGHKPGTPEYRERKRRQGMETYRRNRHHHIQRTGRYARAQAGPGDCDDCGETVQRRAWVRSRSWVGRLCGPCAVMLRRSGDAGVLLP